MSDEMQIEYDRDVIGKEVEVGDMTITREMIDKYAQAVGETNPLYTDDAAAKNGPYGEVVAPIGLLQTMHHGFGPDAKVTFGTTSFHAGQKMEFFGPVHVGDTITASAQVKEVYGKTGRSGMMVFTVSLITYRKQGGDMVATMEHSFVRRDI